MHAIRFCFQLYFGFIFCLAAQTRFGYIPQNVSTTTTTTTYIGLPEMVKYRKQAEKFPAFNFTAVYCEKISVPISQLLSNLAGALSTLQFRCDKMYVSSSEWIYTMWLCVCVCVWYNTEDPLYALIFMCYLSYMRVNVLLK